MKRRGNIISATAVGLFIGLGAGPTATAQATWEFDYGSTTCVESGFNGVEQVDIQTSPVLNHGFIAVGSTEQTGLNGACGQKDVYLVRTTITGARMWENHYDIGDLRGDDVGLSVAEVPSGFVVVGTTKEFNGIHTDIFILKVDGTGAFQWATVYGRSILNDDAQNVIIAAFGNGTTTNAGDIIVAGSTHQYTNPANRDAWLLRTDALGQLIWSAAYDGIAPGNSGSDFFMSLTETTVTSGVLSPGDIVAVGGTTSYTPQQAAWAVRVNGNTGATLRAGIYSGVDTRAVFNGVIEMNTPGENGNLVYVGESQWTNPMLSTDIYVVKSSMTPCQPILERTFDMGGGTDIAFDVVGGQGSVNNLFLTGKTNNGQAGSDAFLLELASATLGFVNGNTYGDHASLNDVGFSLNTDFSTGSHIGFIICGQVNRAGDRDLYLVRTNLQGRTGCESPWNPSSITESLFQSCFHPDPDDEIEWTQMGLTTRTSVDWGHPLCVSKRTNPGGSDLSEAQPNTVEAIVSYPNPVVSGKDLGIDFTSTTGSDVKITVTTIDGKQVNSITKPGGVGRSSFSIPTGGWAAGTYMVQVDDGERTETVRIVIVE